MRNASAVDTVVTSEGAIDIEALRPLWSYLAVAEQPSRADVIFVFGSRDLRVPAHAAALYRDGHAPRVLVSGSFGLMTRGVFPKAEALVFADHLVEHGVPRAAIVVEPIASNTLENVRLGMTALGRVGVVPRSALLVAKGFVMRRCVATFQQQCPDVEVIPCPPGGGLETALDRSPSTFSARLVAEVDRLERYAARGHIRAQSIPQQVRTTVRALTSAVSVAHPTTDDVRADGS